MGRYRPFRCRVLVPCNGIRLRCGTLRFDHPRFNQSISNIDAEANNRIHPGNPSSHPFGDQRPHLHPSRRYRRRSRRRGGPFNRNRFRNLVLVLSRAKATPANAKRHEVLQLWRDVRRTDTWSDARWTNVPSHARIPGHNGSPSTTAAGLSILPSLRPEPFQPDRQSLVAVFK